ncbi:Bestrophin, RFP-TM, chloride channel-domain-containing protein [Jimgerdemannia flammicorona]|uniref:Bestrophin, RFP-TM, chloride channel-domain-containing protein n=1 Tax=Jimgerdemannia flammicorona TaxID=994334 RepID=A0A433DDH3_9FUNG|nr:Bestrophin, RFP-TM, chloride channel-domain-containing protein [Jimgerdemannia flammicorona]
MASQKMYNPYKEQRYALFTLHGSIVDDIFIGVMFSVAWSVLITALYEVLHINLAIPAQIITILSFVASLILAFRTNTAYERFIEARRVWGTMTVAIRNLARLAWIHSKEDPKVADLIEKKTIINLLLAYAIATKHYLRYEFGTEHKDLKYLLGDFPSHINTELVQVDSAPALRRRNLPFFHMSHPDNVRLVPKIATALEDNNQATPDNIPLQITFLISAWINHQTKATRIDVPTTNGMMNAINSMVECLTTFERILRTPMPAAYSIQLAHTVWIYLIALPFQLVSTFHWITLVVVAIAAFTLLGFEAIGKEIENPFGYDPNDMPLDDLCDVIRNELEVLTSTTSPGNVETWIFSKLNKPFHSSEFSAVELKKQNVNLVRQLYVDDVNFASKAKGNDHGLSHSEHTIIELPVTGGTSEQANESEKAKADEIKVNEPELRH